MSLTAGTAFHGSTKPLRLWFLAIHLFVSSKQGISAMDLKRKLGLSYPTAWTNALSSPTISMAPTTTAFLSVPRPPQGPSSRPPSSVSSTSTRPESGLQSRETSAPRSLCNHGRCRLAKVADASAASLGEFLEEHVAPGSRALTDGWSGYNAQATADLDHTPIAIDPTGLKAHQVLPGVHRVFSLLHRVLLTTYQGAVRHAYLPLYLAEFEFRFNRRHSKSRGLLFQRALSAGVRRRCATYWEIIERDNPRRQEAA